MTILKRIERMQEIALCLISKWWRPVTCIGLAGGTIVNLILIPLWTWEMADLTSGAAWITATTAAFGIRTWEKKLGVARGS